MELGVNEEFEEVGAGEAAVLVGGVGGFVVGHAAEEAQQEVGTVKRRIDVFVPQFAEEAAVATVDNLVDDSKVVEGIVEDIAIDMVNYLSLGEIRDADESAYHEVVAVTVPMMPHLGICLFVLGGIASAVGGVTVCKTNTVFVHKVPIGMGEERLSVDHLWRDKFDKRNHNTPPIGGMLVPKGGAKVLVL